MKHLGLFLVFSFLYFSICAQLPGELKWKDNVIKNKIKVQTQWNHKYEKGKPKKDGYKNFSKTFDRNGNVLEEIYYSTGKEERIDQRLLYKYDDKDNRIEHINTKVSQGRILLKQNFTYDKLGRKIKEDRFNGSEYEIINYKYDSKNRIQEIVKTDTLNEIIQIRVFEYSGSKSITSILTKERKLIGKVINTYDKNENIIETTEYDVNNKITEQTFFIFEGKLMTQKTKYLFENFSYMETYTYDPKGNLIEVKREQPKGNTFINNIYAYDANGNLIEEQWYDDDPTDYSKKTYFYNQKGLLEKVEVYYASYKYKMQYRYDYKTF